MGNWINSDKSASADQITPQPWAPSPRQGLITSNNPVKKYPRYYQTLREFRAGPYVLAETKKLRPPSSLKEEKIRWGLSSATDTSKLREVKKIEDYYTFRLGKTECSFRLPEGKEEGTLIIGFERFAILPEDELPDGMYR